MRISDALRAFRGEPAARTAPGILRHRDLTLFWALRRKLIHAAQPLLPVREDPRRFFGRNSSAASSPSRRIAVGVVLPPGSKPPSSLASVAPVTCSRRKPIADTDRVLHKLGARNWTGALLIIRQELGGRDERPVVRRHFVRTQPTLGQVSQPLPGCYEPVPRVIQIVQANQPRTASPG